MNAAASYEQAFARFLAQRPAAEQALRSEAFARFREQGFPDRSTEAWHYTDLTALAGLDVQLSTGASVDATPWALEGCSTQVWVNGESAQPTSSYQVPAGYVHGGLGGLHGAFARQGLDLHLAAGESPPQPLLALCLSTADSAREMHHLAHRIRLDRGSRAIVILREAGLGEGTRWITRSLEIDLADGAELTLLRVQEETAATTQWFQGTARLQRDARLHLVTVDLGGALARNDWRIRLAAPGAQAQIHGLFAPTGRSHVDNQIEIEHAAPHTTSREVFRGLGFERSRAVLNGRVVVRPGAAKTDSEQRIASLMLSKQAEINAKPELEIYADDVKCAHGATFGQLDRNAIFYLRARGVPEATARGLLTCSFANEVLGQIAHEGLRTQVARVLLQRLGVGADLGLSA